jgi:hypothetical protein
MISKLYLLAYNAALICGWGYVLFLAGTTFVNEGAAAVYGVVVGLALFPRSCRCLEVFAAEVLPKLNPMYLALLSRVTTPTGKLWRTLGYPASEAAPMSRGNPHHVILQAKHGSSISGYDGPCATTLTPWSERNPTSWSGPCCMRRRPR